MSAAQARAILGRYPVTTTWRSRPLALFCLIGGALVAAGIALVVAHTWEVAVTGASDPAPPRRPLLPLTP